MGEEEEKEAPRSFMTEELVAAANRLAASKTPGPNGIMNEVMKKIAREAPTVLLEVMNKCLDECTFPARWKRGSFDTEEPGEAGYRPL